MEVQFAEVLTLRNYSFHRAGLSGLQGISAKQINDSFLAPRVFCVKKENYIVHVWAYLLDHS